MVKVTVSDFDPAVPVMVTVVSSATSLAVTNPVELTVAASVLLEAHERVSVELFGDTVATNCNVSPFSNSLLSGLVIATLVAGTTTLFFRGLSLSKR